jgi:2-polyprenyl-6-methoxyphenol hydroxylase-like FAD-dependent oxidoreductase
MSGLKVLIVGASVAGPTTAYWLAKAGAQVTIIERFPELRTGGQNVDIRNVGVSVMRKIPGMEDAVKAKTTGMDGISFVNDDGRPFATMTATGDANHQSLVSEYEIFRGDLARILFDLTRHNENIKYVFGEQISSMRQQQQQQGQKAGGGPVTVEFANGYPTSQYDLVVACDGATSRTRAMGLGCGVRDHITSLGCWSAYFSVDGDLLDGSKTGQAWTTPGGRFFGLGPDPSGVTRVIAQQIHPRDSSKDVTLPFREAAKKGTDALKSYVAGQFSGGGWKTSQILDGMMRSDDFYASEIVQVKVPSLHEGRFVLVGDAGYAPGPTGTGTSLAMAGAYVLAGEIGAHGRDLEAGLRGYEERMRPIIDDLQKIPPGIPWIFAPQTAWGIWIRNTILTAICWGMGVFGGVVAWASGLFSSSFGGDKFGLPDYEWAVEDKKDQS